MTAPRYQDVKATDIPEVIDDDGTKVRVVTGDFWEQEGPVEGVAADPRYLDISVPPGKRRTFKVGSIAMLSLTCSPARARSPRPASRSACSPKKTIDGQEIKLREQTGNRSLVVFDRGDEVTVQAGDEGVRFLLVSGKPIESRSPGTGRS